MIAFFQREVSGGVGCGERRSGGIAKCLFAFLLSCVSSLGMEEVRYKVIESGQPGPTLLIFAPQDSCVASGDDAVRQLQYATPQRGRMVLASSLDAMDAHDLRALKEWQTEASFAALVKRYEEAHTLVFREDEEAHVYDKRFLGDTVRGNGEAASAILQKLRSLENEIPGKSWEPMLSPGDERRLVVTANARLDMKKGLRPAIREREFRAAAHAFLQHLKMIGADGGPKLFPEAYPDVIRVAVYDGPGAINETGRGPAWLRSRLARDTGMIVELVGPAEILHGALDRADVLVMGGGKTDKQLNALGETGREVVSRFVTNGGGYVGICAGAYLASESTSKWNYLGLLPVSAGATYVESETPLVWSMGPLGAARTENADLRGGPMFRLSDAQQNSVTVWARFAQNETSKEKGEYQLKDTPAVISGMHGKGRVLLSSTHCERPPSPSAIFPGMIRWSAGKPQSD